MSHTVAAPAAAAAVASVHATARTRDGKRTATDDNNMSRGGSGGLETLESSGCNKRYSSCKFDSNCRLFSLVMINEHTHVMSHDLSIHYGTAARQ